MQKTIDLRSDTVTKPTAAMLSTMLSAEVGDDVYGEDPTVTRLEQELSERVGMEAGLFVCSGTQSNLLGIMSHCERGDEYIAGQQAHVYRWEGGGAAVLGSIQPQPLEFELDGSLNLDLVQKYIKPDDAHHARTKLLCIENTQSGKVLPLSYLADARKLVDANKLQLHLDGARAFNAAVQLKVDISDITKHFDSVSICLSKGLGAPVGSVLCGSKETIKKARRWRKVVGGGMRQAGILAAAGLYAIQNNVNRLAEDHNNAARLAQGLSEIDELNIDQSLVQTNMVFVNLGKLNPQKISQALGEKGILTFANQTMRLVTHLDVSSKDIKIVIEAFKEAIGQNKNSSEEELTQPLRGALY
ncbi:MAG: low-specificity L-threonine aldolase [Myxococcaceae bacterium]